MWTLFSLVCLALLLAPRSSVGLFNQREHPLDHIFTNTMSLIVLLHISPMTVEKSPLITTGGECCLWWLTGKWHERLTYLLIKCQFPSDSKVEDWLTDHKIPNPGNLDGQGLRKLVKDNYASAYDKWLVRVTFLLLNFTIRGLRWFMVRTFWYLKEWRRPPILHRQVFDSSFFW